MRAGIEWPSVARADDEGWRNLQQQKTLPVAAHISERVGMAALLRLKRALRALASEGNLREQCEGRGLPTGATSAASDWRRLAERVGFGLRPPVENKELTGFRLPPDPLEPLKGPGRRT